MAIRALLILCVCLAGLGCPVMDELDKSHEAMERYGNTNSKKDADATSKKAGPPPGSFAEKKAQVEEGMKQWWQEAKSINTGEVDESIVRCEIGSRSDYMRRDDCLSRGGRPANAS